MADMSFQLEHINIPAKISPPKILKAWSAGTRTSSDCAPTATSPAAPAPSSRL